MKTKADLLKDITTLELERDSVTKQLVEINATIVELHGKLAEIEELENESDEIHKIAHKLAVMKNVLVEEGFTNEEAFIFITQCVLSSMHQSSVDYQSCSTFDVEDYLRSKLR